jgi:arylsulfatase B
MPPRIALFSLAAGPLLAAVAGAQRPAPSGPPQHSQDYVPPRRNVLLLVADDLGVDKLGLYGIDATPPPTPNIDQLAASGVLFRNAWSQPTCSPTRATIQTGRYGFRTGIGRVISLNGTVPALPIEEPTLPEMLDRGTQGAYAHAAIGKWHLGNADVGGPLAPNLAGYGFYSGSLEGQIADYFAWTKVVNGVASFESNYATSEAVDDALAWIGGQSGPWFCMVAFQAPHAPFHVPPAHLHSQVLPPMSPARSCGQPGADPRPFFDAMVEALDTEIGRLLGSMDPGVLRNTTVIFVADNGTDTCLVEPPTTLSRAKGSLYEGGIHVPLIVAGAGVSGRGDCEALVNTSDLMATVANLAGFDLETAMPEFTFDSVSLVPYFTRPERASLRSILFAEIFTPNGPGNPEPLPPCPSQTVCQQDVGFAGPGTLQFEVCGEPLYGVVTANVVPLSLTGAPPFAPATLRIGPLQPGFEPSIGAQVASIAPTSTFSLQTSSTGEVHLDLFTGTLSNDEIYQFQVGDPATPQGWALSSAVRCELLWTDMKAIRESRYKLLRLNPCHERLYDLIADPFETSDLLEAPELSPSAQQAYLRLADKLDRMADPTPPLGLSASPTRQVVPRKAGPGTPPPDVSRPIQAPR